MPVFLAIAVPILKAAAGAVGRYAVTTAVRATAARVAVGAAARTAASAGGNWARIVILNPKAHIAAGTVGTANLGGQLIARDGLDPRDWRFDHVDWGAVAVDYLLGVGAFGLTLRAGKMLPAAARDLVTGGGAGRISAAAVFGRATGEIALVQTGLGAIRSVRFGTDCFDQILTADMQTPLIGFRKAIIQALVGLNTPVGAVIDGVWNATQEIALRNIMNTNPGQGDGSRTCSVQITDAAGRTVQAVASALGDSDADYDVSVTQPHAGRAPGHGDTFRFQRFLSERGFYKGRLDGERTPETIRAANEYARATGLRPPNPNAWSEDTQRAYLRLQVAGWLDPMPGEAPLSAQERIARTRARGALETLQMMPQAR
jgi:hypothetical protein